MNFEEVALYAVLGSAFLALIYAWYLVRQVLSFPAGDQAMGKVAFAIQQGANVYLSRQFKTLAPFVLILTIVLFFSTQNQFLALGRALAFLLGSTFSALVGAVGMNVATRANVRVAEAAKGSFKKSLELAFRAGSVTGMLTVGLGLLGATVIYLIYREQATQVLVGFGFGGSLLALFMRVGGGIYTKAADVGADLVGKIEKNIPEDDPRNAAVIADLVGDNVGDCAGMAADIFESYEVTLVASMILGGAAFGLTGVLFPLMVRGIGVITSMIGTLSVRGDEKNPNGMFSIQRAFVISAAVSILGFYLITWYYTKNMSFFWATVTGIILAVVISLLTEYFTAKDKPPVKEIVESTKTGPATTILSGLAVGLESTVWAVVVIVGAIFTSLLIFGGNVIEVAYGISLVGMGMLTTTGVIVAMDSFGPVADNADGIVEMAGLPDTAAKIMNSLDAVGNTTKAITKGFAISSAVVAATSLFESFLQEAHLTTISISDPKVFMGLLIGGAAPFLFSSLTIQAVSRAAFQVVNEVRRQFREIKGLFEGQAEAEYAKVVDICTSSALKGLITPGLLAILLPIIIGFWLKEEALGGFLGGIILTGQLLAVFMANTGGAWDNAKKAIEGGLLGGKGSNEHKASIIGDTVGDPLKDTSGPALNPLIKVMNLVALLAAPMIVSQQKVTPQIIFGLLLAVGVLLAAIWFSKRKTHV